MKKSRNGMNEWKKRGKNDGGKMAGGHEWVKRNIEQINEWKK